MKIALVSVGKPRDRALIDLHDLYAARIRRFGVAYEARWVPDAGGARAAAAPARRREALALREDLDGESFIALDPQGALLTSEKVAEALERWAAPRVTFVIGGPLGLDREFQAEARSTWSLSPLTFPHELVRVLVAEQMYRALTIRRGVPYHK